MLISSVAQDIGFDYLSLSILYAIIKWGSIILVCSTLGFFVGNLVQSVYSYLFAIPFGIISTYLNITVFDMIFSNNDSEKISHLFSLQEKYISGTATEFRGPIVDACFLAKFLLVITFCILLMLCLFIVWKNKINSFYIANIFLCIAVIISLTLSYFELHPRKYRENEKLYVTDYQTQPIKITCYTGDIDLSEWTGYTVTLKLVKTGITDSITIRLDESMKIKSFKISGQDIEYTRKNDYITFSYPRDVFELNISAYGRVSYVNNIDSMNIYTSFFSSAIPPDFAFLPKIDGDDLIKEYNLNVKSTMNLVSNLDFTEKNGIYILKDKAENMCIFSGFLKEETYKGMTVYHAKYNKITDYHFVYNYNYENDIYFDYKSNQIVNGKWNKRQKVFIINYLYGTNGFPVPYDNYVMLNYGYMS